jgi:hypothetical protein
LNPQVQVDPLSLSMTTLPPILPVLATVVLVVPEVLALLVVFEVPPHAATSMATAATDMSHLKRFIETLRSPFDDRQFLAGSEYVRLAPRAAERVGGERGTIIWEIPKQKDLIPSYGRVPPP